MEDPGDDEGRNVMHKKVVRIAPDRTVLNAIELMRERNTNVLIVVENITSGREGAWCCGHEPSQGDH